MESIFSIIFAFLVEAIILLQYASRLFSPKRPLSDRLVVLSLLYTCLCAVAFFNIKCPRVITPTSPTTTMQW